MISIEFISLMLLVVTADSHSSFYTPTKYEDELIANTIGYRLSNNTAPKLYTINFEPHIDDEEFTFDGTGSTLFEVLHRTKSIIVHASELIQIDKTYTKVICSNGSILEPISQRWNPTLEFFNVRFDHVLETGLYTIKFKWRGRDAPSLRGFYRGYYRTTDQYESRSSEQHMVATHFQATAARAAFPCWDEPGFKAEFEISIKHYRNYTALSNMPVKRVIPVADDSVWTTFEKSPLMPTYLVTFAVAPYTRHINPHGNITFWMPKDRLEDADLAFNVSQMIIPAMEEYTGIHYALPKMDQIVIPQYSSSASEHWGLISYSKYILHNPDIQSITEKDMVILLAAHEISHNWFGNLVTPAWWSDIWLSEAFAVYFSYKIVDEIFDDWHGIDIFSAEVVNQVSFRIEQINRDSHPIKWMPQSPGEIRQIFGPITYRKGAAVVRMLEHILTEEIFCNGLRKYLNRHQFGSVVTDDLWQALQEAHDEGKILPHLNIKGIMDPWIEQTDYPLLNTTRNNRNGFVTITQTNALNPKSNNFWMIPINYATSSMTDFSSTQPAYWMRPDNGSLVLYEIDRDDWFILNIQNTGFYRVNYDNENWRRLAQYLNSDNYYKIHVLNRGQLLHDILYFADKESRHYELAVDLVSYLHRETNYLPWIAVIERIDGFYERLMNTPSYDIFEKWMLHLMNNIINHVGFEDHDDDDHLTVLARHALLPWACTFGHRGCRRFAALKLAEILTNEGKPKIHPENEEWIYCWGLMSSNETLWDIMMDAHLANPLEKPGFEYLGCTENQILIKKYLLLALADNATHLTDQLFKAFDAIASSPNGNFDFTFDFFTENFDAIEQHFNERYREGDLCRRTIYGFGAAIRNIRQFEKFTKFLNKQMEKDKLKSYGNDAIQSARDHMTMSETVVTFFNSLLNKKSFFRNLIISS